METNLVARLLALKQEERELYQEMRSMELERVRKAGQIEKLAPSQMSRKTSLPELPDWED